MKVVVDTSAAGQPIRLAEGDDFGAFCVEMCGSGDLGAALVSQDVGWLEDDHAFVTVDALKRLGPRGTSREGDLEQMAEYARSKGWTDASGTAIQAHIETA